MKLLGLTGGVGMGKSTTARFLEEWQIPVVDTDLLARRLVEPGEPALDEIRSAFGPEIIGADGRLARGTLAELVFGDEQKRLRLEAILHPRIRAAWEGRAMAWRREGRPAGAVMIPLLFETGAEMEFDVIICAACSTETQRDRLRERGWEREAIERRIGAQWSIDRKVLASDFIIWTDTTLEMHLGQLIKVLNDLGLGAGERTAS